MRPPIILCDKCTEVISHKPKEDWYGFSTTKTGYIYCGRCGNN